ncbi:winged helix-turn-helix domain-containing protein [Shewanella sp. NIFS-20-20]|uniref:nSTAND1 domain-containing NTPase n=1 Tax=Shewanella sp. NIFS-20-20 TaxID=2853806 RepID=UPI001C47ECA7|nr:winged helix-turn-helix domain-containing protein [Shewanella sp. NIFS-20-20]MBV7316834.1 winged helix-turn-helix domain-containing protein [Shewanella sp. NIFS-20-20]
MDNLFFFGDWQVEVNSNSLRQGDKLKQLEPKAMDVLLFLCQNPGQVVSSDDIVKHCWPNIETGDNPLHKVINQLRRVLGDSATAPTYIETIRKRGYRTLAAVTFPIGHEATATLQAWQGDSPFPGLQAYSADYAEVFFGRNAQISTLLKRIAKQVQFGRSFSLVLGPSGSGKSSLIHAGILPNLMAPAGYHGIYVPSAVSLDFADVPQQQLLTHLAATLLDWDIKDEPVFSGWSAEQLADALKQDMAQVISCCQAALAAQGKHLSGHKNYLALVVDRLEVLLASQQFSPQETQEFVDIMEQFATCHCVLVISACRNDFYPELVAYPSLMAGKGKGAHFDLAAPTLNELLQMIRLPAQAAGLRWEVDSVSGMGLDELLCSEAMSNPDALPMLQYTLQALYLQRSSDDQLCLRVYQDLGGIEGAIGKNAEEAVNHLTAAQKATLPRILSLLVTLREDEQSITSRSARWSQLQSNSEKALVQALVDSRLFVSHLHNNEACFSIAHEALLRRWPRASQWIEQHKDSLAIKSRLQQLSKRWRQEGRNRAYLLADGKPLKEAQSLQQNPLFSLEPEDTDFIAASTKRVAIGRWLWRGTGGLLCLLTLTSVLMSIKSYDAQQQAQQRRLSAENLLGFMVGDFADKLRSIGRMDLLDGISNKALEYFSNPDNQSADQQLSFDARFQYGQTLEAMGEVAYSRGKNDEAEAALLAARNRLLPLLVEQADNLELLKTLGANAFWLGQLEFDKSDWLAARPWFEQYLSHSQAMVAVAPEMADALAELAYAQSSLGSVDLKNMAFEQATTNFERALVTQQRLLSLEPNNEQWVADIANTQSWLASAMEGTGNIAGAIRIYEKIELSLQGVNEVYAKDRRGHFLAKVARLYFFNGDTVRGEDALKQAHLIRQEMLVIDPNNQNWLFDLMMLNSDKILQGLVPLDDTASLVAFKRDLLASSKHFSAVRQQRVMALGYWAMAKQRFRHGLYSESLADIHQSVSLLSSLYVEGAEDVSLLSDLSEAEMLQARVKQALDDLSYRQHCANVAQYLAPVTQKSKDPRLLIPYQKSLECLDES